MIAFAIGSHPDDIEFMMGGTLLLLKERGCEIHYMNIANGSCGTQIHAKEEIIRIRREESMRAAAYAGAVYHESIVDDLAVFYSQDLISRVAAVVREVKPDIVLTLSLLDYMEDHMNAARIAVTASFVRTMRNYETSPSRPSILKDTALFHALPYGLTDMIRRPVVPEFYVDVTSVIDRKAEFLSRHASQKDWLDKSQGLDSYLIAMREMSRKVGAMSGRLEYAEGWRQHSHLGYAATDINPLQDLLGPLYIPETKNCL
jgi:LmbE family N-acetylglucosaminyl deacetylase